MTTDGARPGCHTGKSGGILLAATSAQVGGRVALRELSDGILGREISAGGLAGWVDE